MGKSKEQVEKFIVQYKFRSEIEFEMINSFCNKKLGINLAEPKEFDHECGINPSEFSDWYENGFAQGEVVGWNGNLAILRTASLSECSVSHCIWPDGRVVANLSNVVRPCDITHATQEQINEANRKLFSKKLELNLKYLLVVEKFTPANGQPVKFWNDTTTGYGWVREITKSGEVVMYCYMIESGEVNYSTHDSIGHTSEYHFEEMTLGYRRKLERELNKYGKSWNDYKKRIEPAGYRLEIGATYFYFNDLLRISRAEDNGKVTSNLRYLCGNYFHSYDAAKKFASRVAELLKEELAK